MAKPVSYETLANLCEVFDSFFEKVESDHNLPTASRFVGLDCATKKCRRVSKTGIVESVLELNLNLRKRQ